MFHKMIAVKIMFLIVLKLVNGQNSVGQSQEPESPIFFDTNNIADGAYTFRFRTPDNTVREESGGFDVLGNYVVSGFYSYVDDSGQTYYVQYTADKDGYHPLPPRKDYPLPGLPGLPTGVSFGSPPQIVAALLG